MTKIFFDLLYCILYGVIVWAAQAFVRVVVPYLKVKLQSQQYSWAAQIIENAVRAYEQMIQGEGLGEDKYKLVLNQVVQELNKIGIELTNEQIAVLIEAAVHTMNTEASLLSGTEELTIPVKIETSSSEAESDE